jgi:hypothetical protein
VFGHCFICFSISIAENIYWAKPGNSATDAYSIETTAYALLAMLKFNDMAKAAHIVRWLTSQQNAQGVFKSTQVFKVQTERDIWNVKSYVKSAEIKGKGKNNSSYTYNIKFKEIVIRFNFIG